MWERQMGVERGVGKWEGGRFHAEARRRGGGRQGKEVLWQVVTAVAMGQLLPSVVPSLSRDQTRIHHERTMRDFYVYILTNTANVIYIGVTNNLSGRFWEHTMNRSSEFCLRYNLDRLVYFEVYPTALEAIAREKQLKGWSRKKKVALIQSMNPGWRDLSGRFRG